MADIYSVSFDEVNDFFDIQDDASLDIIRSNGDQFYIFGLDIVENAGSFFQYFLSNNSFGAANSINIYTIETSQDTNKDKIRATPQTVTGQVVDTAALSYPTGLFVLVMYYDSVAGKLEFIHCPDGGTATRTTANQTLTSDISSSTWNLGRRTDGNADRYYGGKVLFFGKGSGTLTDANVESLAADMLTTDRAAIDAVATADVFFPMNEGSGPTITDDVLGLTGTGVGFTGSQWVLEGSTGSSLTLNNISNTQSIDQVSLTQKNSLNVSSFYNSQSINQTSLSQNNLLSVDNSSQAQELESLSLTQSHLLIINGLDNSQSLAQLLLSQNNNLLINKVSQAQFIDLVNLNVIGKLSVDSFFQSQSLDIVTLTEVGGVLLSIVNISQNQSLTGCELIQHILLSVDNLSQAQLIDTVNFGGIVIGYLQGELSIIYAYNGKTMITNALTGETLIR